MIVPYNKPTFKRLYTPILIEQFFFMLMAQVDMLMLSSYSSKAIAISGISQQVILILMLTTTIIHVGTSINFIYTINRKKDDIWLIILEVFIINLIFTTFMIFIVLLTMDWMILFLNVPKEIESATRQFTTVLLVGIIFHSTTMLISTLLRTMQLAKYATWVSIIMNITNVCLNAIVLFILVHNISDPVIAVAHMTNISKIIGCVIAIYILSKQVNVKPVRLTIKRLITRSKMIVKLGLPSAGENISYNISQFVLTSMISLYGVSVISGKLMVQTFNSITFTFSVAFAIAAQIYFGKFIAKHHIKIFKKIFNTSKKVIFYQTIGIHFIVIIGSILLMKIINTEHVVFNIIFVLLFLSIALEPLRAMNVLLVDVLNVYGDVYYPVSVNVIVTWLLTIPLSYILGIALDGGIYAIWIVLIIDEFIRYLLMNRRMTSKEYSKLHFNTE